MSKYEKAKERILQKPADYTYTEAKYLLGKIGFEERNKGKTSGSRVCFFREEDKAVILLHKPHPGDEMNRGAVSDLVDYLKDIGEL
ncbi:MAG: type II toxin-antitoxin system HicA family toxin [Lachnospiraceae bacterium]|nr:type II toxin-antitoxin system HicA family toxin [Lachnospiraceae bacterium]MBD5525960.1 type II toxin-antitoxin system HicA family toxin [Lachnospiraceae bacterium]MDE6748003.1 type II toxin-antitoxin system HicA family toxin [Lachnospiraceae bacterium]